MSEVTAKTAWRALAEKYWLSLVLLLLVLASVFSAIIAVLTALFFTFLVPGLIGYRFFPLKKYEIWAFIPVFSILVSVSMVYYASLAFGYSRDTIRGF